MTGETPRRAKRKEGKTLQGGTLFIIKCAWGYCIEPYSIYQGEEEEVLLERDLSGEVEDESVIGGGEFIVVSLRMVDTPGDSHKGLWEGSQMKCGVMDCVYFCHPNHL